MHNKHSQETKDRAIRLRQEGNPVRAISKECGVSLTILKGWFAEVGLAGVHSARLPEGNREALSHSFTVGWNLANENFMKGSSDAEPARR